MLDIVEGKKVVVRGLILLGVITIAEVIFALFANGHIIHGFTLTRWIANPIMIAASVYKAYFIMFYFMHLKYEVKGMVYSILVPVLLLVWGVIAFLQEGNSFKERRQQIIDKNNEEVGTPAKQQGAIQKADIYHLG